MALALHLHPSFMFRETLKFQSHKPKLQPISCTNKTSGDAEIATELAIEVAKINTQMKQKEEAMRKSREILFNELCEYACVKEEDEMRKKWKRMEEEEKWVLLREFVANWGDNFHPLSAKSVKEMVDEYLHGEEKGGGGDKNTSSYSSFIFPGLKRLMGFPQNK